MNQHPVSNFGKYLKLTKSKIMLRSGEKTFTLWNIYDNKKLILDEDDIAIIQRRIFDGMNPYADQMADAILKKYVIKFCADKDYYVIADKSNFIFIMGLKKDTLFKIIDFYAEL